MKKTIIIFMALFFGLSPAWPTVGESSLTKAIGTRKGQHKTHSTSCRRPLTLGVYSSECDLRMSADGKLFLDHDREINGLDIEMSPSSRVRKERLADGERIT